MLPCSLRTVLTFTPSMFKKVRSSVVLVFYRLSPVLRSAVRPSSSGSSSTTCVTGSWCGASHTRGTGRWPTSTLTCSARRTPGPRWAIIVQDLLMLLISHANLWRKIIRKTKRQAEEMGWSTSPPNFKQAEIPLRAKLIKDQSNFCCVV